MKTRSWGNKWRFKKKQLNLWRQKSYIENFEKTKDYDDFANY